MAVEQGRLLLKALDAMVAEIDAEAAAAETANEPEPAGHVSAETSADEPATVTESPIPVRTGRATALVHIAEHADRDVEIDATAAVTAWQGERMDYSTAIEWLLHRDGVAI